MCGLESYKPLEDHHADQQIYWLEDNNNNNNNNIMVKGSTCLTTNHEVADWIPGTSTILNVVGFGAGSIQPRKENWVAT